jgi:hypothetical protein
VGFVIALNGAGILLATAVLIAHFDLTPWWYCAALAAWALRVGTVYRTRAGARSPARGGELDCQETAERN